MPSPVRPSQFRAAVSAVVGTLCDKFYALLSESGLFSQWFSYVFKESGEFTDEFKADVCGMQCICPDSMVFGAPALSATYDTVAANITVTWSAVPDAVNYIVERYDKNPATDPTAVVLYRFGPTTELIVYDSTAENATEYFYRGYSLKADDTKSGWSAVVVGRRGSSGTVPTALLASVSGRPSDGSYVEIDITVTGGITFVAGNITAQEIWVNPYTPIQSGAQPFRIINSYQIVSVTDSLLKIRVSRSEPTMAQLYLRPAYLYVRPRNSNVAGSFSAVTGNPWYPGKAL